MTDFDRVMKRTTPELPCLIWQGAKAGNGYGVIRLSKPRRMKYVHRIILEEFLDRPIRKGFKALHSCDRPSCVRAEHLFEGTQKQNMEDCSVKGRTTRGEKSGTAKLTWPIVKRIRKLYSTGAWLQRELAELYGCCRVNIHRVVAKETWK